MNNKRTRRQVKCAGLDLKSSSCHHRVTLPQRSCHLVTIDTLATENYKKLSPSDCHQKYCNCRLAIFKWQSGSFLMAILWQQYGNFSVARQQFFGDKMAITSSYDHFLINLLTTKNSTNHNVKKQTVQFHGNTNHDN